MNEVQIPREFQPFLWSVNVATLEVVKHRRYIIHQLLRWGDLDAFRWLKQTYSLSQIQKVFIEYPDKIYSERSFAFTCKFLLHLEVEELNAKERYVAVAS